MAIIYNGNSKLKTADDLVKYLSNIKIDGQSFLNIRCAAEDTIVGLLRGKSFSLIYHYSKSCVLVMKNFTKREKDSLIARLNFVMMGTEDEEVKENGYFSPIFKLTLGSGDEIYRWELEDPEEEIRRVLYEVETDPAFFRNVDIFYPYFDKDDMSKYYLGKPVYLEKDLIKEIENYSEYELFVNVVLASQKLMQLSDVIEDSEDYKIEYQKTAYLYYYLMQQTVKFGVPSNPPAETGPALTKEQNAWLIVWSKALDKWAEENPEAEVVLTLGLNEEPLFMPDMTVEEYLREEEKSAF